MTAYACRMVRLYCCTGTVYTWHPSSSQSLESANRHGSERAGLHRLLVQVSDGVTAAHATSRTSSSSIAGKGSGG